MKVSLLFLSSTAVLASLYDTILPRERPTITSDPWQCATEKFDSYFDVPKPTGSLLSAIVTYGNSLQKGCKSTLKDAMGMSVCTFPTDWCGFTEAAPTAVLTPYSSYASAAYSWWDEHSAAAVEDARYCPNKWFSAMTWAVGGAVWLNDTIAFASCYMDMSPVSSTLASTSASSTLTSTLASTSSISGSEATLTGSPSTGSSVSTRTGSETTPATYASTGPGTTSITGGATTTTQKSCGVVGRAESKLLHAVNTIVTVTVLSAVL